MNKMLKTTVIASIATILGSAVYAAEPLAQAVSAPVAPKAAEAQAATADSNANAAESSSCLKNFSASVAAGYESAYIFRGKKEANESWQLSIELGYALTEALGFYADIWHNAPFSSSQTNRTDLTFGVTYAIAGFTFDAGYTYTNYQRGERDVNRSGSGNEFKFGVAYDLSAIYGDSLAGIKIVPSAYFIAGCDQSEKVFELAVSASAPLSKWLFGKEFLALEGSAFWGFSTTTPNNYNYVGLTGDLVWNVTDYAAFRLGLRWAANDDGEKRGYNQNGYSDNNIWYGVSLGRCY